VPIEFGVFTCLRTTHGRAALIVTAAVAVMGLQTLTQAPLAPADTSGTPACAKRGDAVGLFSPLGPGALNAAVPACSPAPAADALRATGRTLGSNPGAPGQCTWGAAQKWFEASGSYPALSGDALAWGDSAAAAGWTVVDDPQDRSIVVFEPGVAGAGSIGHVAWVDSVSQRSDGRYIHVTEMNNAYYGGAGIFDDRDIKNVPGMSYILLP
jgi:surface antigen